MTLLLVVSRMSQSLVFWASFPGVAQDQWWETPMAAAATVLLALFWARLWRRFGDRTFPEVMEAVLGKPLGKAVSLVYVCFLLLILSLTLRLTGEFFLMAFMPKTPILVIIGSVAFLSVWGAKAGLEVIARASQVVFPLLVTSVFLVLVLLLKDVDWGLLWPPAILYNGPVPHLKDMTGIVARNMEFIWLAMILPFLTDRRALYTAVARAYVWIGLLWICMSVIIIGMLGQHAEPRYFPFLNAVQMISIADFLERIDAIVLGMWIFGMFLRGAVFLWAPALGLAKVLGLQDYRPLVLPLGGLAVTYAVIQADSLSEILTYMRPQVMIPFLLTFVWVIPLLLLVIVWLRDMGGGRATIR